MALHPVERKRVIAAWLFVAVAVIQGLQALLDALPNHAFDTTWPAHARFHVTIGAANQLGFAIAAVFLALIPLKRGERWGWWLLLSFAVLSTVALIPAAAWHGSGPPPGAWILIGACIAAMTVALALTAPRNAPLAAAIQPRSGRVADP